MRQPVPVEVVPECGDRCNQLWQEGITPIFVKH